MNTREIVNNVRLWYRNVVNDIQKEKYIKRRFQNRCYEHNILPVEEFNKYIKEGVEKLQGGKEIRIYKTYPDDVSVLAEEIKIQTIEGYILDLWNKIEISEQCGVIIIKWKHIS